MLGSLLFLPYVVHWKMELVGLYHLLIIWVDRVKFAARLHRHRSLLQLVIVMVPDDVVEVVPTIDWHVGEVLAKSRVAADHCKTGQLVTIHHGLLRQARQQVGLVGRRRARCQQDVSVFFIQHGAIVDVTRPDRVLSLLEQQTLPVNYSLIACHFDICGAHRLIVFVVLHSGSKVHHFKVTSVRFFDQR